MAGLFALLYGLFSFFDGSICSAREYDFMQESKKIAIERGNLTYMDSKGWEYFVETGERCSTTFDHRNGHRVIKTINSKGLPTGRILYDYTEKEKEEKNKKMEIAINDAKLNGKKYLAWFFPTTFNEVTGIEIETGKKYVLDKDSYVLIKGERAYSFRYLTGEIEEYKNIQGYIREYYIAEEHHHFISKEEYYEREDGYYHKKALDL